MAQGLNVSRVVNVQISLTQALAGYRNFGAALVMGSSPVIDVTERKRDYNDIEGVGTDFGTTAPEYLYAQEHFSQVPQPNLLSIGRWAQTATSGLLHGAILTPAQRLMSNFTAVTNGAMTLYVDGVPYALTGLNFASATNLNGVASIIQAALVADGATGARVIWGANNNRFDVISGSTGTASSLGYTVGPVATDSITYSTNPSANATLTLNGTTVTFVAASPTGNQVLIGGTLSGTLANLLAFLNGSNDPQITKFDFSTSGGTKLNIFAAVPGSAGNALTVAATAGTVASATLAGGGTGTDISVLTGLSATPTSSGANADAPIPGVAAETALAAAELMGDMFGDWYELGWAPLTSLADSDAIAVAGYIEAAGQARIMGLTTQNTAALDDTRSDDLGSVLKAAGYSRTFVEYSSTNPYAAASLFARFATINYTGSNTTITGKFKQQPGVIAEVIGANAADTLAAKNINVYAAYQNGTAITQEAVMASGIFIDSRINADACANAVQTDAYNLLKSLGKLPQTDQGMAVMGATIAASLQRFVVNGYLAEGVWNASPIGTLDTGDVVPGGFYIFIPKVATQSEADRAARKSVLFQIAAKEAGAVHSADILINVNP